MRAGDLLLDRYRIHDPLPTVGELERWAGRDERTGEPVEITAPTRLAQLRPTAEQAHHQAARAPADTPGVTPPLASGRHDGRRFLVWPGGFQPWPQGPFLTVREALDVAGWLLAAAMTDDIGLVSGLRSMDLRVSPSGTPVIVPSGVPWKASAVRRNPHEPPEGPPGSGADTIPAVLYGLGSVLYAAVTGSPAPAGRIGDNLALPEHPEAHTLSDLLTGLLAADPTVRLATARQAAVPGQAPALRTLPAAPVPTASAPSRPAPVTNTPTATPDLRTPDWVTLLPTAGLTNAAARRAEAMTGLPVAGLLAASHQGLAVPVGGGPTRRAAEETAAGLQAIGVPLEIRPTVASTGRWISTGLTGLATVAGAVVALGVLGVPGAAIIGGVGALLTGLLGVQLPIRARHRRAATQARDLVNRAPRGPRDADAAAVRSARARVLTQDLPTATARDLLQALDDIEDELELGVSAPRRVELDAAVSAISEAAATRPHTTTDTDAVHRAAQAAARTLREG